MSTYYPFLYVLYMALIIYTMVVILLNTETTSKALGYLVLVLFLPVVGMAIYYSFGLNLRHMNSRAKMMKAQKALDQEISSPVEFSNRPFPYEHFRPVVKLLNGLSNEPLCESHFSLLTNGEEKFPEVLRVLDTAQHFIHMEYYAWENDIRGNEIKKVLLKKAKQGLKIRVLYDDYASRRIKPNIVRELKAGGVEVYPRIKVKLDFLANRINHRDHRKLIIVDGIIGFVGGINVSDRYDNSIDTGLYWRDTHVKIVGPLVNSLQRHFIISWNSCQPEKLKYTTDLFPGNQPEHLTGIKALGQVVAGGPTYPLSNIMLTYSKIFSLARKKLYITNPYFIPNDSILDALKQAAISGVDVRILMPYTSDSMIVGAAAKFYYPELVRAGVRVFLYKKGFVHAKTVVADGVLSVIGTANMDLRSFDLNFEIMSVIYGEDFSEQFEKVFIDDLNESVEVTNEMVSNTNLMNRLFYSIARLMSSFL